MASTTSRISVGCDRSLICDQLVHHRRRRSWRRPAVSRMTTSLPSRRRGLDGALGDVDRVGAACPRGRRGCRAACPASAAARRRPGGRGRRPPAAGSRPCACEVAAPSLAAVVVLPEPCRPDQHVRSVGGLEEREQRRGRAQQRGQLLADDLHHLLGRREASPSPPAPMARSATAVMKSLTTLKLTSASSRARRTSRRPRRRRLRSACPCGRAGKTPAACRTEASNMGDRSW